MSKNTSPCIMLMPLLLICSGFSCLNAQNSMIMEYDWSVNNTLLCTDSATGNDIVCYNTTSGELPCFLYHSHASGATRTFVPSSGGGLPGSGGSTGLDTIRTLYVKDMVMGSGYCYFCGTLHTYTPPAIVDPPVIRTDDYIDIWNGIFGRFPLNEITNPDNHALHIQYLIIPNTDSLERLEKDHSTTRLAATARNSTSRGFVLLEDAGTTLQYQLLFPSNPNESVTDIAFTRSYLVAVSGLQSESNEFIIRNGEMATVYNTGIPNNLVPFDTRYSFITSSLVMAAQPDLSAPTQEYTHDIRVAKIPSTQSVVVAYEGSGDGFDELCHSDQNNTNVYGFDLSSGSVTPTVTPVMTSAQIVSLAPVFAKGFKDVRYLQQNQSAVLLYNNVTDPAGMAGIIQYPSLVSYGQKHCQPTGRYVFPSMDVYGASSLQLVGWNMSDRRMFHFTQDILYPSPACIPYLPTCHSEEMTLVEAETEQSVMISETDILKWNRSIVRIEESFSPHTVCEMP